jgi:hypothetical protein
MRPSAVGITVGVVLASLVLLAASAPSLVRAADFEQFGFESVTASLSTNEAGAHPDLTTALIPKTDPNSPTIEGHHFPYAAIRDVAVELPPGLLGNLNAVDQCSNLQFAIAATGVEGCPLSSQVGISELRLLGSSPGVYAKSPIYELETTDEDTVARFGFLVLSAPVFINVYLRSDSDYGVTARVENIAASSAILEAKTTLWGVPADASHNNLRFTAQEALEVKQESPSRPAGHAAVPFLSNPTSCGAQLSVGFTADSYPEPGRNVHATAPLGEISDCAGVGFDPSFTVAPTNKEAAAPSGADAALTIPQNEEVDGRATSQLRDAVIKLPKGFAISPTAAEGLAACSESEVGYRVSPPPPAHCREAAKIADVTIDSPSLSRPINGAVYQRTPEPGHLFRAWLVADELGAHIKVPGEFQLDPVSGQITTLFLETPQVPIRSFELHFKGGDHGVLSTPRACGTYQAEYALTPWSGQGAQTGAAPMTIDQNCRTGGFAPKFKARSLNPAGGAFSSLFLSLSQASGEQNLSRLQISLPPGLLAKLKNVTLCPEPAAPSGNCPDASRVGHVTVATGPGSTPLWIPQPGREPTAAYLAGGYQGGPYSLVIKAPAEAGPFDLGDVVVRVALQIDPTTTQVTAVADALPQIIEGVPIAYRDVRVEVDRANFIVNPTSCDPMAITGNASSTEGAASVLASRFQVTGCSALPFKPKLRLALRGKTRRAGNPALSASLRMPADGANIAWTRVSLPKSLQIDNAHINNPCTRVQFNAAVCPRKSILGRATATSPLLDEPLSGPVYFRSNGGERELPDIVADLHGAIRVVLVGYIDAKNERIRTTFAQVPDAPVSQFRIALFGGRRGLLQANRDICASTNRALIQFNGQNGKTADTRSTLKVPCGGNKGRKGKKRR